MPFQGQSQCAGIPGFSLGAIAIVRPRRSSGAARSNHLSHHAGNFRWGVELPLALARLGGEVAHQLFVGVAQKVIALGAEVRCVRRRPAFVANVL